ncbi:TetR family transcriptional regulator [Sphingomonas suaedae]|uniref:TetR family transcriptional regulator n=1 Tax=Sphingomonas suaedae TaxID=2599297 RepID=A0A518RAV3_9SPHN|nr:TetR/AcrR family transcriptional regulator [Sphingomonas suaedae]QDX24585.1 TetR family transcriptional regulator [Sphingomonas suaedae]
MAGGDRATAAGGLRERKRRETAQRIADVALRLFLADGYEATTLDAIAEEAGISRRTFFYYYKSKDDILISMQSGMGEAIAAGLSDEPEAKRPIQAIRDIVLRLSAGYPADEMIAIDRLMRSSEAVMARKQASYVEHERTVFAALREKWPDPDREASLRVVAMLAIGCVRLGLEAFNRDEGSRPVGDYLREAFDAVDHGL